MAASVFFGDLEHDRKIAEQVVSGMDGINTMAAREAGLPVGGVNGYGQGGE